MLLELVDLLLGIINLISAPMYFFHFWDQSKLLPWLLTLDPKEVLQNFYQDKNCLKCMNLKVELESE